MRSSVDAWLTAAATALAREGGVPRDLLELDAAAVKTLLDLAGAAAHRSGARTNAPLFCYLVGLTAGRGGGDLAALAAVVDQVES